MNYSLKVKFSLPKEKLSTELKEILFSVIGLTERRSLAATMYCRICAMSAPDPFLSKKVRIKVAAHAYASPDKFLLDDDRWATQDDMDFLILSAPMIQRLEARKILMAWFTQLQNSVDLGEG